MQRHYAHHRLNGEKYNATAFLSARRDDARERSLIQRALKTLDRHLHEPGVAFTSTRAAREWLILNMAGLEREEFRVLYLNNQNQLIAGETLFTGTINRTEVHPREVIKRALYHNAAAVVLAHNHPSGEVTPSKADRLITERLVQALGLVDIRVHQNKDEVFERGVINVFRGLSWNYKTNSPCKFGSKIIVNNLVRGDRWGLHLITGQQADRLADLERMLYLFSGKPIPDNRENIIIRLDDHIRSVQGKACYEDEMFNIRYFKKGSAHITFRKPELVDRLNDIIARHYSEMLPSL